MVRQKCTQRGEVLGRAVAHGVVHADMEVAEAAAAEAGAVLAVFVPTEVVAADRFATCLLDTMPERWRDVTPAVAAVSAAEDTPLEHGVVAAEAVVAITGITPRPVEDRQATIAVTEIPAATEVVEVNTFARCRFIHNRFTTRRRHGLNLC